jgi:hypothetical protein
MVLQLKLIPCSKNLQLECIEHLRLSPWRPFVAFSFLQTVKTIELYIVTLSFMVNFHNFSRGASMSCVKIPHGPHPFAYVP